MAVRVPAPCTTGCRTDKWCDRQALPVLVPGDYLSMGPDAVAAMSDIFLARQPIFDRRQSVVGYELLYRHGNVEQALIDDDEVASARVAINALTEIGLQSLVGDRRAWINVTREFLLQGLAYSLPPGRVVLELLEGQLVDQPLLDVLADVRAAGYQLGSG